MSYGSNSRDCIHQSPSINLLRWTYFCYTLGRRVLSNKRAPCPQTRTCRTWRDWKTNKLIRIFELQFVFCTHAYISKNLITQEFSITKLTQHFFKKMWRAPSIYIGFRPLFFQSQVVGSSWQPQAGDFWISTDFAARSAKSRWELGVWRRILPLCGATLIIFLKRWLWRSMKVQLGKHYWRMSWEKVILMWNNKQKLGI